MPRLLQSNAVTLFNDETGKHEMFFNGMEIPDWAAEKLSAFHFEQKDPDKSEPEYYEDMRVPDLLNMCKERGVTPSTNRKSDIIDALKQYDETEEA